MKLLLGLGLVMSSAALAFPAVQTFDHTFSGADPTQTGRIFRNGVGRTKSAAEPCSIFTTVGAYSYRAHTFTNDESAPITVAVDLIDISPGGLFNSFAVAYTNYDPADLCGSSFIGDIGVQGLASGARPAAGMAFEVQPGASFTVVVHEIIAGAGGTYRLRITRNRGRISVGSAPLLTINDNANASPYPSSVNILDAETGAIVQDITVHLAGVNHTFMGDIDLLLVAPDLKQSLVLADNGGSADAVNDFLSFNDAFVNALQTSVPVASGLYQPTGVSTGQANFLAPAPAGPYNNTFAAFQLSPVNGNWSFFGRDDAAVDSGNIQALGVELVPNTQPSFSGPVSPKVPQGEKALQTFITFSDKELPDGAIGIEVPAPLPAETLFFTEASNVGNGLMQAALNATCDATVGPGFVPFTIKDSPLTLNYAISSEVLPPVAPTPGSYNTAFLLVGGDATILPSVAPADGGSVASVSVTASAGFTGSVSATPDGVITVTNPGPKGTHTFTVSSTDNCGLASATTATFTVVVGIPEDTDGDGLSNELEIALGSNPNDPASTPSGVPSGLVPELLNQSKAAVKLAFAKANADSITISGVLSVPKDFPFAGQPFVVDFGGVIKVFTLDKKATAKAGGDSVKISAKKDKSGISTADQFAKFSVKLSKGSFASFLSDEGLGSGENLKKVTRSVRTQILFASKLFASKTSYLYSAKANVAGAATSIKGSSTAALVSRSLQQAEHEANVDFMDVSETPATLRAVARSVGSTPADVRVWNNGQWQKSGGASVSARAAKIDPVQAALTTNVSSDSEALQAYVTLKSCSDPHAMDVSAQTRSACEARIDELARQFRSVEQVIASEKLPPEAFLTNDRKAD